MLATPQAFVYPARNIDDIRPRGVPDALSCTAFPLSSIAERVPVVEIHPLIVRCDLV